MASATKKQNTERNRIYNRAYYASHKKSRHNSYKSYYAKNKAHLLSKNRDRRNRIRANLPPRPDQETLRSRMLHRKREHYKANSERIKTRIYKSQKEHPEYGVAASMKRRALKRGAATNLAHIREWMKGIKQKKSTICYYCQNRISSDQIHFDHIIALSKGGAHSVENLCVSCAPCNLSKHAKQITAWVRIGQQVLSL